MVSERVWECPKQALSAPSPSQAPCLTHILSTRYKIYIYIFFKNLHTTKHPAGAPGEQVLGLWGLRTGLGVGGQRWVLPAEYGSSSCWHEVPALPLEGGGQRGDGHRGDGQQGDSHCSNGPRGDGPCVGPQSWRGCWECSRTAVRRGQISPSSAKRQPAQDP